MLHDKEVLDRVEQLLRLNCPSPESELTKLSGLLAYLPETEEGAWLRRIVLDVDDLIAQTRWHLGQALLLLEVYPGILILGEGGDGIDKELREIGMPASALLLLRGFIKDADRVLYDDLSEGRRGGTVAGWIFHMMIDSAIYRVVAALDRLAHLLWHVAGLPKQDSKGKSVRIYFRAGKIAEIDNAINDVYSNEILKIAAGPLMEFIVDYRNKYTHEAKAYSVIAGSLPADEWSAPDGTRVIQKGEKWEAELLFALGRAGYHQLVDVLRATVPLGERKFSAP